MDQKDFSDRKHRKTRLRFSTTRAGLGPRKQTTPALPGENGAGKTR